MFTREITGLTLTKQVADGLFPNITGKKYGNDESFIATLRAMLHSRVPKEESISMVYINSRHSADEITSSRPKDVVYAFLRRTGIIDGVHGTFLVHSFEGRDEDNAAALKVLDENGLDKVVAGYTAMNDVATFFKQQGKINVRVFINEERKSTVIFVDRMTLKKWHFIQSMTPRYFPWYFRDNPVTEKERELVTTLTKRYAPAYEESIEEFSKQFDFRSGALRIALDGFEINFERDNLRRVREKIARTRESIGDLERQFQQYYQQLNDLTIKELGLVTKIRDGDEDGVLDFFLCNKTLELINVSGGSIEFVVKTILSNYDPDMFDRLIESPRSFFYRHYETGGRYGNKEMTDERIKRLMKAVFHDELLKIRVCAAYKLDFSSGEYRGMKYYSYPEGMLREYTPNQHIEHYACLGNNEQVIYRAMRDRDYITALSACGASATNINFSESNTGTYFMEKIFSNDVGRIIQMPDGSTKTPLDAVKWLEEQDGEKTRKKEAEEVVYE